MFVYGDHTTHIGTEPLPYEKCPACGNEDSMTIAILSTYYHLFWVPLFPFRKYGAAHCTNCDTAIGKSNMSESLARSYETARYKIKFPWWNFLGPILIVFFFILSASYKEVRTQIDYKYLNNPKKGDVYIISNLGFSLSKVISIQEDNVVLVSSNRTVYFKKNIYQLYDADFKNPIIYTKAKLLDMYEKGMLYDIDRN